MKYSGYGVQQKEVDVYLLAHLIQVQPLSQRVAPDQIKVNFNHRCILWHKDNMALVRAGCMGASMSVENNQYSWAQEIKASYYGILRTQLKGLRGGQWRSQLAMSDTAIIGADSAAIAHGTNETGFIETRTSPFIKNGSYRFQINPRTLVIDIPIEATLSFADNTSRTLRLIELVKSKQKDSFDYSNQEGSLNLIYRTNQSLTGVTYTLSCAKEVLYNNQQHCAITHSDGQTTNPVIIRIGNAVENTLSRSQQLDELRPGVPFLWDSHAVRSLSEGLALNSAISIEASGLGQNKPGVYQGQITLMAKSQF